MLFEDPGRTYPHLKQALNLLAMRRFDRPNPMAYAPVVVVGAGMLGAVAGSELTHSGIVATLTFLIGFVGSGAWMVRRSQKPVPPLDLHAQEATEVAKGMGIMLARRRLHRDIDGGSLLLLDECARYWLRARAALDAPYWTSGKVALPHATLRQKALAACDGAMDDVLLHYRAHVPEHVEHRNPIDYVDEALEQFTFRAKGGEFPPAEFALVRQIADKLRDLAQEAEHLGEQARQDPIVAEEFIPRTLLDETLSELREIRMAEEELRQNTRG